MPRDGVQGCFPAQLVSVDTQQAAPRVLVVESHLGGKSRKYRRAPHKPEAASERRIDDPCLVRRVERPQSPSSRQHRENVQHQDASQHREEYLNRPKGDERRGDGCYSRPVLFSDIFRADQRWQPRGKRPREQSLLLTVEPRACSAATHALGTRPRVLARSSVLAPPTAFAFVTIKTDDSRAQVDVTFLSLVHSVLTYGAVPVFLRGSRTGHALPITFCSPLHPKHR